MTTNKTLAAVKTRSDSISSNGCVCVLCTCVMASSTFARSLASKSSKNNPSPQNLSVNFVPTHLPFKMVSLVAVFVQTKHARPCFCDTDGAILGHDRTLTHPHGGSGGTCVYVLLMHVRALWIINRTVGNSTGWPSLSNVRFRVSQCRVYSEFLNENDGRPEGLFCFRWCDVI